MFTKGESKVFQSKSVIIFSSLRGMSIAMPCVPTEWVGLMIVVGVRCIAGCRNRKPTQNCFRPGRFPGLNQRRVALVLNRHYVHTGAPKSATYRSKTIDTVVCLHRGVQPPIEALYRLVCRL